AARAAAGRVRGRRQLGARPLGPRRRSTRTAPRAPSPGALTGARARLTTGGAGSARASCGRRTARVRILATALAGSRRDTVSGRRYLARSAPPGPEDQMHGNDTRRRTDVAVPLARFALAGLLAVIGVGAIGVALQRNAARDDAISDATTLAKLAGNAVFAPHVTRALLQGDPQQIAMLNRLVDSKMRSGGIVRVKLWDRNGRIVY